MVARRGRLPDAGDRPLAQGAVAGGGAEHREEPVEVQEAAVPPAGRAVEVVDNPLDLLRGDVVPAGEVAREGEAQDLRREALRGLLRASEAGHAHRLGRAEGRRLGRPAGQPGPGARPARPAERPGPLTADGGQGQVSHGLALRAPPAAHAAGRRELRRGHRGAACGAAPGPLRRLLQVARGRGLRAASESAGRGGGGQEA
mmetsp:Transcript_48970/g.129450  ORF Transcript_48970/g.129450 Transcript_48970/m.129450 type:complete len:201 (+) Transcript_48970:516-1118(+)